MALLRWMGVSPSSAASATSGPSAPAPAKVPLPADMKRFGFENFGNTCYANSILQALYFCSAFRELVINSPDLAYPDGTVPVPPAVPALPPGGVPASVSTPIPTTKSPSKRGQTRRASQQEIRQPPTPSPATAPAHADTPGIPTAPPTLFSALRSLFIYISHNADDKGTVSPLAFVNKVRQLHEPFRSPAHQDAHEFMNYLLNKIVEDIDSDTHTLPASSRDDLSKSITSASTSDPSSSGVRSHAKTFVHALFEGVLTSETRCLTCENVSARDESFLDLSIDIEQNSSVTACLRSFSASEMLCQRNKFFCDACCGLQEAEKRMKIKKLPNVLALHLKRFKYQEDTQKYVKLAYRVAFPHELRLFDTVDDAEDPDRLYELFAIVVHIGTGPHHGHYIAIIKSRGTWLVFDDNSVETMKESEIPKYFGDGNGGSGYVLFYQAVDLDRQALGLPPKEAPTPSPVQQHHQQQHSPHPLSHQQNGHDGALTESPEVKVSVLPPVDDDEPPLQEAPPTPAPKPARPKLEISPNATPEPIAVSVTSPTRSATGGLFRKPTANAKVPTLANGDPADPHSAATSAGAGSHSAGAKEKEKEKEKSSGNWPWKRKSLREKSRKPRESASASEPMPPPVTPTHATFASDSEALSSPPPPLPPLEAPPSAFFRRPSTDAGMRRSSTDTTPGAGAFATMQSQHTATSSLASSHHPAGSFSTLATSASRPPSRPPSQHALRNSSSRPTSAGNGTAIPFTSIPSSPPPLSPPPPLTDPARPRKNSGRRGLFGLTSSSSSAANSHSGALSDGEAVLATKRSRGRVSSAAFSPPPPPTPSTPAAGYEEFSVPDVGASPPPPPPKPPNRKMSLSGGLRALAFGKDRDKDRDKDRSAAAVSSWDSQRHNL